MKKINQDNNKYLYHSLTWEDIKLLNKDKTVLLLPVGSTEQHGPQNPLGTDHLIVEYIANHAAQKVPYAYALPLIPVGVSSHHRGFSGTLWFTPSTLRAVIKDIFESIVFHGFKKIIVVNGHGGNTAPIMEIIGEFNDKHGIYALLFEWWRDADMLLKAIGTSQVVHADVVETSVMWAIQPAWVKTEKFEGLTSAPKWGRYIGDFYLASRTDQFSESGIAGSIEGFSQEKGQKVLDASTEKLVKHIELLSNYP